MHLFHNLSIRGKLALVTLLTSALPLLLATVGLVLYERTVLRREAIADLGATADIVGSLVAPALDGKDQRGAESIFQAVREDPDVLSARLYDRTGHAVASYSRGQRAVEPDTTPLDAEREHFDQDQLLMQKPILSGGSPVGSILLRGDVSAMQDRLQRYLLVASAVVVVTLLAAFTLASRLQRSIFRPVTELTAIAHRVAADHDFTSRVVSRGDGELAQVIDAFNTMLDQIQGRDAELKKARDELEKRVEQRTHELSREQTRFQCVFDAAPVGFSWMVRGLVETRIVNPAHVQITGVAADHCRQLHSYRDATHPDDRPRQDVLHAQLLAGEIDHYDIEKRYVHHDGAVRWVALTVRFYHDQSTNEIQEINTIIDITERRHAEIELAKASRLLGAMMDNTPDLIYFKDRESRFVHYSKAFANRFNLTDSESLRGKTDFDLFTAEHAQPAFNDEREIIRTGEAMVSKLEKETYVDGRTTWAMTTKMPWRDIDGTIIGTFGISKDVSELKEAEAKAAHERDLLQCLLDNFPDTIYFKDLQSRFVRVSRSKAEKSLEILRESYRANHPDAPPSEFPAHLTGIDAFTSWLIGKTDFDVFGEERALPLREEEETIIRTGLPVFQHIQHATLPTGQVVWHVVTKMPWRDKDGNIIGTFGTSHDITPIKETEAKLAVTNKQLLKVSRQAGMAEVATGVLHNVGNVLNSINVSATLVVDHVRHTKALNVAKLAALFSQNKADLATFLTVDPRGQLIPNYLESLAESLAAEHQATITELNDLRKNVEHVKDIVTMQQAYARTSGVVETVSLPELVEDALRMNAGSLARHDVVTVREYQARGVITTDKHKVIQILINLVRNAKYACDESGRTDKQITVRTASNDHGVIIAIIDNGVGIPPENLTQIFSHGFTTRAHGHGFGLHSGALAAKELGGTLIAQSDGPGRGATFTLELPYKPESARHEISS